MRVRLSFGDLNVWGRRLYESPEFDGMVQTLWMMDGGSPPDETPMYHALRSRLAGDEEYTPEYLVAHVDECFRRYREIREGGYHPDVWGEYPAVSWTDSGYAVADGSTRLAALVAAGIEEADFTVTKTPEAWADVRVPDMEESTLRRLVEEAHSVQPRYGPRRTVAEPMNLYLPIAHPAYRDAVCSRFDSPLRLALISDCLRGVEGKRVLDVGCNSGFFSVELARAGAYVTAVDPFPAYLRIAEYMRRYHGVARAAPNGERRLRLVPMPVEQYLDESEARFDVALHMGLFHHQLRAGEDEAWMNLRRISERCHTMFFETALSGEPQMEGLEELTEGGVVGEVVGRTHFRSGWMLTRGLLRNWADRGTHPELPLRPLYAFTR